MVARTRARRFKIAFAVIVVLAVAVGVGLRWRALLSGFASDDYVEYAMLKGVYPVKRAPLDLFNFADGTEKEAEILMNFGALPWWAHPKLRLAMMRPLSSALIVVDHAVFGGNPFYLHLHSMFWWAFLVVCAALLLRELLPFSLTAVAVVLFAIEEGHALPVVWLANRSALVSLSLGLLGLWGHILWRRSGHRRFFFCSIVMFFLALLAGEWAFTVFAYLFAFELWGIDGPARERLRAFLPAALLGLIFIVVQHQLNYSTLNSNVYINPIFEPLVFLSAALRRIPIFFADIVFGVPAFWFDAGTPWKSFFLSLGVFTPEIWNRIPDWQAWHLAIGALAGLLGFFIISWGVRSPENRAPRALRWLFLGGLLALVPGAASFPSTRLVVPGVVGISAVWSLVILAGYRSLIRSIMDRRLRPLLVALSILLCMGYFQVWKPAQQTYQDVEARVFSHESVREWILQAEINDCRVTEQDIFLINGIEHTSMVFTPFVRYFHGHPMARSCRIMSAAPRAHDIERTAINELEFTVLGGNMLASDLEKLYRADRFPLRVAEKIKLKGLTIEIVRLLDDRPFQVRYTFDKALEDPSYLFLYSSGQGIREFKPPPVGGRIRIPRAQYPNLAFLRSPTKRNNMDCDSPARPKASERPAERDL
ncbi:MAG: hypothetical protein JXA30_12110 [Deltaproteobacteria bacterium]|nr:hypothetical protein [Deltaproteobacteria bacterium]